MTKALIAGASQGVSAAMAIAVLGVVATLVIRLVTTTLADYVNLAQLVYWLSGPLIVGLLYRSARATRPTYPQMYATPTLRLAVLVTGGAVAVILVTALYLGYAAAVRLAPSFPMAETQFLYQELLARIGGLPFILTALIALGGCTALAQANLFQKQK